MPWSFCEGELEGEGVCKEGESSLGYSDTHRRTQLFHGVQIPGPRAPQWSLRVGAKGSETINHWALMGRPAFLHQTVINSSVIIQAMELLPRKMHMDPHF